MAYAALSYHGRVAAAGCAGAVCRPDDGERPAYPIRPTGLTGPARGVSAAAEGGSSWLGMCCVFRDNVTGWVPTILVVAVVTTLVGICTNQFVWTSSSVVHIGRAAGGS